MSIKDKIKEEEFSSEQSEDELINQIENWYKESEDIYSILEKIRKQNLDYYNGKQTDVEKIRGKRSRAVENRVWMAVETMVPIATSRLPDITVKSEKNDEKSQTIALDLQDIINLKFEENRIKEKSERWTRDMIMKRLGIWKIEWVQHRDDFEIIVRDPKHVRIPVYGANERDLKYIIDELELSDEQVIKKFGEDKLKKLKEATPENKGSDKVRKKNFKILETWTNDYVVWSSGKLILKKEDNPYFSDNVNKNYIKEKTKPYVIGAVFKTKESMIPETDYIQQTIPIQDNINKRKRQIEDIAQKVANPMLLIDSQVMSEEKAATITNEEGLILYGKDAADGSKVRFENPGQLPAYVFNDLQESRGAFDNIWGVHSTTRGERQGKETLGGRMLLRQGDMGRIDLVARELERSYGKLAIWATHMIKMFYENNRTFNILGPDGLRFIENFRADEIGDVELIVKPGSTLPKDEISLRQEALQLWQQGAIGIKTLYKQLQLPNVDEAVNDFIETRSGRIFQQSQQPPQQLSPFQTQGENFQAAQNQANQIQ